MRSTQTAKKNEKYGSLEIIAWVADSSWVSGGVSTGHCASCVFSEQVAAQIFACKNNKQTLFHQDQLQIFGKGSNLSADH